MFSGGLPDWSEFTEEVEELFCGNVVARDIRSDRPVWRVYPLGKRGCASVVATGEYTPQILDEEDPVEDIFR